MDKFFRGIVAFKEGLTEETRERFARLAAEQKPHALLITCSDSRLVPSLVSSSEPGELFIVRNVGNLVPRAAEIPEGSSVAAALEFSVLSLGIADIIICGHSECGAMQALLDGATTPHVASWIRHGEECVELAKRGAAPDPTLSLVNQLSQINVLKQMEHLESYPFVLERLKKKKLHLYGLWFDIARAEVYRYDAELRQFTPVT